MYIQLGQRQRDGSQTFSPWEFFPKVRTFEGAFYHAGVDCSGSYLSFGGRPVWYNTTGDKALWLSGSQIFLSSSSFVGNVSFAVEELQARKDYRACCESQAAQLLQRAVKHALSQSEAFSHVRYHRRIADEEERQAQHESALLQLLSSEQLPLTLRRLYDEVHSNPEGWDLRSKLSVCDQLDLLQDDYRDADDSPLVDKNLDLVTYLLDLIDSDA